MPLAQKLEFHGLTLRFADASIEREICAKFTQSTFLMNMCVVSFLLAQHIIISIWRPALFTVGAIYIPICSIFLLVRWMIQRDDKSNAYGRNQRLWASCAIIGTIVQRATFVFELHPYLTIEEARAASDPRTAVVHS